MKTHYLILPSLSSAQCQYLPSSRLLLSCFAAKWIASCFLCLVKSLEWVDKTPGKLRTSSSCRSWWWFIPTRGFLTCQCFCLRPVQPRGFAVILEPSVSFSVIHPWSWAAERDPKPVLQVPESSLTASAASSILIQDICCIGDGHHCLLS